MDVIHKFPRPSIYERTDYIVNSDMSIPFGLAQSVNSAAITECMVRRGLPEVDRRPIPSPLVLHPPKVPKGK